MGSLTNHGWQNSASNAPQPIGIVMGANLVRSSTKPTPPPKKRKSQSSSSETVSGKVEGIAELEANNPSWVSPPTPKDEGD
jgi:hypothetical protein